MVFSSLSFIYIYEWTVTQFSHLPVSSNRSLAAGCFYFCSPSFTLFLTLTGPLALQLPSQYLHQSPPFISLIFFLPHRPFPHLHLISECFSCSWPAWSLLLPWRWPRAVLSRCWQPSCSSSWPLCRPGTPKASGQADRLGHLPANDKRRQP